MSTSEGVLVIATAGVARLGRYRALSPGHGTGAVHASIHGDGDFFEVRAVEGNMLIIREHQLQVVLAGGKVAWSRFEPLTEMQEFYPWSHRRIELEPRSPSRSTTDDMSWVVDLMPGRRSLP